MAARLVAVDPDGIPRTLAAALDHAGTSSGDGQTWAVFGPILPSAVTFIAALASARSFYRGAAYYLATRTVDGEPAEVVDPPGTTRTRAPSVIDRWLLAGLLAFGVLLVTLVIQALNPADGSTVAISLVASTLLAGLNLVSRSGPSERSGPGERFEPSHCFTPADSPFLPPLGRTALAWLARAAYLAGLFLLLVLVGFALTEPRTMLTLGATVVTFLVWATMLVALALGVAVTLVTYAELRRYHDPATAACTLTADTSRRGQERTRRPRAAAVNWSP